MKKIVTTTYEIETEGFKLRGHDVNFKTSSFAQPFIPYIVEIMISKIINQLNPEMRNDLNSADIRDIKDIVTEAVQDETSVMPFGVYTAFPWDYRDVDDDGEFYPLNWISVTIFYDNSEIVTIEFIRINS